MTFSVCAILAAFFLFAPAARSQSCGGDKPANQQGKPKDFFTNFASSPQLLQEYGYPLHEVGPGKTGGELNSTYFQMFYSIANANAAGCQLELVLVGAFPDARYFSLTDDDSHYGSTQHLSDFEIDPAEPAFSNWFIGGENSTYQPGQWYLAPISLGWFPSSTGVTGGCGIEPFEQDNLLDGTQRHPSMDWNADFDYNNAIAHIVDMPTHASGNGAGGPAGPNTAGSITARNYLTPAADPPPQPYVIVRDAIGGCAYEMQTVISNGWLDDPDQVGTLCQGTPNPCSISTTPTTAVVSTVDLSAKQYGSNPGWNSPPQESNHIANSDYVPLACYNSGAATGAPLPTSVAWVRGPEWVATPSPDDSYIGGSVSASQLEAILTGGACHQSAHSCLMRFRFELPPNTPTTPCDPYTCYLAGNEALRYMSLTFTYQPVSNDPNSQFVGNPDGLNSATQTIPPVSMVSIADVAFATTPASGNNYVTLLVTLDGNLPSPLMSGTTPPQGFAPSNAPIWTKNGYTVLDLSKVSGFTQTVCPTDSHTSPSCSLPLDMVIRNTLPALGPTTPFKCSGAAVPFSTAVYTNADGAGATLMGPYIPMVDYQDPSSSSFLNPAGTGGLPSASYCGAPATGKPSIPTVVASVPFPEQYWGTLNCQTVVAGSPAIDFIATQRTSLANPTLCPGNVTALPLNPCTQIEVQATQDGSLDLVPPVPLTIVGSGFGYLPYNLPMAATSLTALQYLRVENDGALGKNHVAWDTDSWSGACQIYITNWRDTSISLLLGLPAGQSNQWQQPASPPTDISYLSFFFKATPPCPVAWTSLNGGDDLTLTVTNPQSGAQSTTKALEVQPSGSTPQ